MDRAAVGLRRFGVAPGDLFVVEKINDPGPHFGVSGVTVPKWRIIILLRGLADRGWFWVPSVAVVE